MHRDQTANKDRKEGPVLSEECLAEICQGPGLFIETLWQSPNFDDEVAYSVVDSRTNTPVGSICYRQVTGKLEEGVIYKVYPFTS
jgi:hypothetical protein